MIGQIFHISNAANSVYPIAQFDEFYEWARKQTCVQCDIETDVKEKWNEFTLISIQFGTCQFNPRKQYFFQWSELTGYQKQCIKEILEDPSIHKLAHNGKFEYIIMRFNGIIIENIYDTMLGEKILRGGYENENYSLADISWKYLRIIMNKEEQTQFGDNIITDSKLLYGVTDVAYLDIIKRQQIQEAAQKDLLNVFALEMEALPGFSDMTYNGMGLDVDAWRTNIALAEPLVKEATDKLNAWLMQEPFYSYAVHKEFVSPTDRCVVNFNAPAQRTELIKLLFPDLSGGTKPMIKKYIRDKGKDLSFNDMNLLMNYIEQNYELMEGRLVDQHKEYLIDKGYLIPAGQITINWNSRDQVLPLIQLVLPKLKSLAAEEVTKFNHQILDDRSNYADKTKLITTYGENFIQQYLDSDGKVRANINQVVSTGRISMSNPNMQQIPAYESVGTRYRNAFLPDPGWVFVDSDYTGQELSVIAFVCKDPVWTSAIERGEDLHSICAELVFKKKWKDAAEEDCKYYKMIVTSDGTMKMAKEKCKCKRHKPLRDAVKTISFGLAYGMSEIKLAGTLKISRNEAIQLMEDYFKAFPGIKKTLDFLGHFGLKNGYIQTLAPFFRKRWFPYWRENRTYVDAHISGIKFHPTLGEIERASKNMPIQGASGDMTKLAVILIRNEIKLEKWNGRVKLNMQVHDQITTSCVPEIANEWKLRMDELMCEAAKIIVTNGILKADTNVSPIWTK